MNPILAHCRGFVERANHTPFPFVSPFWLLFVQQSRHIQRVRTMPPARVNDRPSASEISPSSLKIHGIDFGPSLAILKATCLSEKKGGLLCQKTFGRAWGCYSL